MPQAAQAGRGGEHVGDATPALQMYGSQEDSSIDEGALSSILKTALGVAELPVTDLFKVIDQEEKGRITFGEWPQEQGVAELYKSVCTVWRLGDTDGALPTWAPQAPIILCRTEFSRERLFLKPGKHGLGAFKSDFCRQLMTPHFEPGCKARSPVIDADPGMQAACAEAGLQQPGVCNGGPQGSRVSGPPVRTDRGGVSSPGSFGSVTCSHTVWAGQAP